MLLKLWTIASRGGASQGGLMVRVSAPERGGRLMWRTRGEGLGSRRPRGSAALSGPKRVEARKTEVIGEPQLIR